VVAALRDPQHRFTMIFGKRVVPGHRFRRDRGAAVAVTLAARLQVTNPLAASVSPPRRPLSRGRRRGPVLSARPYSSTA
jgi:hypothetical protein